MEEAFRILREKYEGKQQPSGDLTEDEKTIETAASTILAAALNLNLTVRLRLCGSGMDYLLLTAGLLGKTGLFLRNCQPFETDGFTTDLVSAEKLWKLSEELVEQKFSIRRRGARDIENMPRFISLYYSIYHTG